MRYLSAIATETHLEPFIPIVFSLPVKENRAGANHLEFGF